MDPRSLRPQNVSAGRKSELPARSRGAMDSCLRSIVASHQSTHRTAAFDLLHDDIKSAIVSFLDARSVVALQSCSRDWRSRCTQHAIWERLFTLDFGYPYRAQNSLRPVNVGATPSSSPHWVIRPFIALSPRHGSMTRVVPVTPRAESLRGLELVHARWAYMRSVLSHKATRAASAARFQARKQRFQVRLLEACALDPLYSVRTPRR